MTIAEKIRNEVDRGRLGLNHGISMGLPKLESVIDGVTKETYTLIISNSGAGKTSFALYAYVYKPIMEHLDDDDFKCLYFSMEMNEVSLYIKLLSIYIFETYGIELSYKEILSKKREYVLSDEHYQLVLECLPWIEKVSKKLEIYDKALNAKKAYAILKTRLEAIGRFEETEISQQRYFTSMCLTSLSSCLTFFGITISKTPSLTSALILSRSTSSGKV